MSSLQNDLQFSAPLQRNPGQSLQFQSAPGREYDFFSTPPSPEPLVPSQDLLPDFHTPSFYAFSASPPPTFEDSHPEFEAMPELIGSFMYKPPPRLRSGNRVPRPRNAFMIFRSEFWAGEKISRTVEHDHRHISRIIGHCWNQLPEAEKDKWREKAEQEKADHMRKYPGYRFSPNVRTKKVVKRKVKRNSEEELLRCKQVAELLLAGKQGVELDSAVKSMQSPLDDSVLKERKQESDKGGCSRRSLKSSPKTGELQPQSKSPPVEYPAHLSALDHIGIPIFRSPLLPPAKTQQPISPSHHEPPSPLQYPPAFGSYESNGMVSQQFEQPSPPFQFSPAASGSLCQDEGSQHVPAYLPPPSFDGYSLNPGGASAFRQRSEECLPYLHYNYESTSVGFYNPAGATRTSPTLELDVSAYSVTVPTSSPRTPIDPMMWDFSGLGPR